MMNVATAAGLPDGWQEFLQADVFYFDPLPPDLSGCVDVSVPQWLLDSAAHALTQRGEPTFKPGPNCTTIDSVPPAAGLFKETPADYLGRAHRVPRVSAADLTPHELFWRYVRIGAPVVVTDVWASDREWWTSKAASVAMCAASEYQRLSARYGGVSPPGCDPYSTWCKECVQVVRSGECAALAQIDAEHLPAALRFPPPLDRSLQEDTQKPYILSAQEGDSFGGPHHYDGACMGTLSIQYVVDLT
jgi:hypothetical protein